MSELRSREPQVRSQKTEECAIPHGPWVIRATSRIPVKLN